jgi:O-antigen/teichoic acid export membrane protein
MYFALLNLSLIINFLLDLGITNYNNRNIAQNHHLLQKHLSGIILLRFVLAAAYFVVVMAIGLVLGYSTFQLFILMLLSFNQFLIAFTQYLRSNISGLHLFKTDSLLSVSDRLLMIMLVVWSLFWADLMYQPFRIEWLVYAQTAAYLITAFIALFVVLQKSGKLELNWNPSFFKAILKQSFPYALLILLMFIYTRSDAILLERMLEEGEKESGIYAQAFRLLDVVNMFGFLFAGLLLPMFSKMLKNNESIKELTGLSFRLLMAPAITIVVICLFFNFDIMQLLYKEHTDISAKLLPVLMASIIPICSGFVVGTLLTAHGKLDELNRIAMMAVGINIILNLQLIPDYKAQGAATSALITQLFNATFQIYAVKKIFGWTTNLKLILSLGIFTALIFASGWFLSELENPLLGIAAMTSISIFLAFATRLISIKGIFAILKEKDV